MLSRRTTAEMCVRDLAARFARGLQSAVPGEEEGAGNAGCALHPRSRVQDAQEKRTRAYRFSGGNPAFPAQWFYGLCRALAGDEFVLATVARIDGPPKPGWARHASADLAPATGVRTTRFLPYAIGVVRLARRCFTHGRPPCEHTLRADAAASTASHLAFVTTRDPPLLPGKDVSE
jgi:hypothetical protein